MPSQYSRFRELRPYWVEIWRHYNMVTVLNVLFMWKVNLEKKYGTSYWEIPLSFELSSNITMLQNRLTNFGSSIKCMVTYKRLKTKQKLISNCKLWKWLRSLTRSGRLQQVPNIAIWFENVWYFVKLVAEESWSFTREVVASGGSTG